MKESTFVLATSAVVLSVIIGLCAAVAHSSPSSPQLRAWKLLQSRPSPKSDNNIDHFSSHRIECISHARQIVLKPSEHSTSKKIDIARESCTQFMAAVARITMDDWALEIPTVTSSLTISPQLEQYHYIISPDSDTPTPTSPDLKAEFCTVNTRLIRLMTVVRAQNMPPQVWDLVAGMLNGDAILPLLAINETRVNALHFIADVVHYAGSLIQYTVYKRLVQALASQIQTDGGTPQGSMVSSLKITPAYVLRLLLVQADRYTACAGDIAQTLTDLGCPFTIFMVFVWTVQGTLAQSSLDQLGLCLETYIRNCSFEQVLLARIVVARFLRAVDGA